ncbi:exodeoxyribonuclease VII small subunit [Anaerofustis butyriciformans]|uniref:exodeoxyribonuclease VII small subunit n=1 Tax=Anaerofustis TaxID=264995 RepID=UPI003F8AA56D
MSSKKTFEEKLARLEEISSLMEESKITLDNSVKLYDEAGKLIKELREELSNAEKKVKIFVEEKDNEALVKDFEEA